LKKEKWSPLHSKLSAGFLFLEGIFVSAWMRFMLSFLSGTYRLRWMGVPLTNQPPVVELSAPQLILISRIQLAVARVHRYVPWNTECYTQALTAKYLLQLRGIPSLLTIGFKKDESGEVQGHAWLTINEWVVNGMRHDLKSYVVNGKFY
jgi:Transglutaminase-like superfamily